MDIGIRASTHLIEPVAEGSEQVSGICFGAWGLPNRHIISEPGGTNIASSRDVCGVIPPKSNHIFFIILVITAVLERKANFSCASIGC